MTVPARMVCRRRRQTAERLIECEQQAACLMAISSNNTEEVSDSLFEVVDIVDGQLPVDYRPAINAGLLYNTCCVHRNWPSSSLPPRHRANLR